jgi:multiple sugar transport system ATP-binding protein
MLKRGKMELILSNLTKIFTDKNGKETRAVDGLDIKIPSGTLVSLLGPSGCGKSTTLFMIAGLHKPTDGHIFFGDRDVTKLSPDKRGIGLVFQNYALYPHMTVLQNIMFPLENQNINRKAAIEAAYNIAKVVGIEDQLNKRPAQLSGGQQQRVAIARALVKKPDVLLLDEPLSNLDARLRLQTREEIKRIQRETGITTIFVTHDQEEAMSISDQMVVLNYGVFQQMAAPQDIYNHPTNLFVAKFLGNPPINLLKGSVINNQVVLEGGLVVGERNVDDGEYHIGLRPEDFKVSAKGFVANINRVEQIGRDTTLLVQASNQSFKVIIDSDTVDDYKEDIFTNSIVNLTIKNEKIHLFDKETEMVVVDRAIVAKPKKKKTPSEKADETSSK